MKAFVLSNFSKIPLDTLGLAEVPLPQPTAGQVIVLMAAAALNPADSHIASGEMKMLSPIRPPFALGVNGTGTVLTNGQRFRKGDRVMFYTGLVHRGTLAEKMAVPEEWLARVPADCQSALNIGSDAILVQVFHGVAINRA